MDGTFDENDTSCHYLLTQQGVISTANRRTDEARQFASSKQYKVLTRLVKRGLCGREKGYCQAFCVN